MYEFHGDKKYYFDMTYRVTRDHIIPFIKESRPIEKGIRVLEIGCGEAGALKAFLDEGCECFGIELEADRMALAQEFLAEEVRDKRVGFMNEDIYDVDPKKDIGEAFDVVVLKDVIEHIPNQEKFIPQLRKFLKKGGLIFYAFPPWMMPYGGHQQVLPGTIASKLPYYHLLPGFLYPGLLRLLGVNKSGVATMEEIRSTGISIERFEHIHRKEGYGIKNKRYYLFNPIYEHKFGIKPKRQWSLISAIPFLRDFLTMGVYYAVEDAS